MTRHAEHHDLPGDKITKEAICARLSESQGWDVSGIHVEVHQGVVTITGVVSSKEELHRAEAIAATVPGVVKIENALEIKGSGIAEVISEIGSDIARIITGAHPEKETGDDAGKKQ